MDILNKIKELVGSSVWQSAVISTTEFDFTNDVREACKSNMCGKYNKTWMCPPAVGEIEDLKEKCLKFDTAYVFTTKHNIEDSFDIEGMLEAGKVHGVFTDNLVANLPKSEAMVLGAGSCSKCEKCTYPNEPCRQPDKAIPSVESCGIDVTILSKKCNLNYINGANTVTYFTVVFYNKIQ